MLRKTSLVLALALAALGWRSALAADRLPPASQLLPKNAILAVELSKPKDLLDVLLNEKMCEAVTALPVYQKASKQPKFLEFLAVIQYLEGRLGADWKTSLHKLIDGGVALAVTPDGGSLVVVDALDATMLTQLHEVFVEFAKGEAAKNGQPDRAASADYRGVTGWSLGPGESHAILGNRLLLANKPEILKAAIDRRDAPDQGLGSQPSYQAARKAVPADAAGSVYVNAAMLKMHPPIKEALSKNTNPLGTLLFGGLADALRESNWLVLTLRAEQQKLSLQAAVDGKPSEASSQADFARPSQPGDGASPNFAVPGQIAGLSFYRDLHGFYAAKDKLFPERTSGLIFFENMMGIFFSGRDLTEDILAQIKPQMRFVVARQKFDPKVGAPQVQLPSFAAIFRLRKPKEYSDTVESAWQKAIGLVNIGRGQKAEEGLVIKSRVHNGVEYSVAYFPIGREDDKAALPMPFNFRPSLVKLDDYLVISSTDGLAKDLIDAIKQETASKPKPLAGVTSLIEMDASPLAEVLAANREQLVRKNMVDKGNSKEQAEAEIDLFSSIFKRLGQARLALDANASGQSALLELKFNLP